MLRPLIQQRFPDDECLFFKVNVNHEVLHYIILYTQDSIAEEHIEDLISDHVISYFPGSSASYMQRLRQNNYNYPYLFMMNVDFYIQDYYDVILKRIVCA